MDTPIHSMTSLFEQLGLESSEEAIEQFVSQHPPLPQGVDLCDAPFWSKSQSAFIRGAKEEDADWAEIVDQLDVMLR